MATLGRRAREKKSHARMEAEAQRRACEAKFLEDARENKTFELTALGQEWSHYELWSPGVVWYLDTWRPADTAGWIESCAGKWVPVDSNSWKKAPYELCWLHQEVASPATGNARQSRLDPVLSGSSCGGTPGWSKKARRRSPEPLRSQAPGAGWNGVVSFYPRRAPDPQNPLSRA